MVRVQICQLSSTMTSTYHSVKERLDNLRELIRAAVVGPNQIQGDLAFVCALRQVQFESNLLRDR